MQNNLVDKNAVKIEDALTAKIPEEKKLEEITKTKTRYSGFQKFLASTFFSIVLSTVLFGMLFGLAFYIAYKSINKPKIPQNYEECVKSKGSFIRETYPSVCVTKDSNEFIQPLSEEEKKLLESDINKEGKFCGGIAGISCPEGYSCKLDGDYPDAGGVCVNNTSTNGCKITGCSSEICSEKEVITTCIYKKEYECYKKAVCKKQSNGKCGWSGDETFNSCLGNE